MRKVDPERVAQQRQEIVEAATRCFGRYGVQATTTDQICREAGISPGRLYYYFSSKDQIIEAVARGWHEVSTQALAEGLDESDLLDLLKRINAHLRDRMESSGVTIALAMELFSQGARAPGVQAAVHQGARDRIQVLRRALEERARAGLLRDDADVEALTLAMIAIYSGIEILALTDPDYDRDRYEEAAETVIRPWLKPGA